MRASSMLKTVDISAIAHYTTNLWVALSIIEPEARNGLDHGVFALVGDSLALTRWHRGNYTHKVESHFRL